MKTEITVKLNETRENVERLVRESRDKVDLKKYSEATTLLSNASTSLVKLSRETEQPIPKSYYNNLFKKIEDGFDYYDRGQLAK